MEFYSELGDQKIPGAGKLFNYFKLKNEPNNIQENPQNQFKINIEFKNELCSCSLLLMNFIDLGIFHFKGIFRF